MKFHKLLWLVFLRFSGSLRILMKHIKLFFVTKFFQIFSSFLARPLTEPFLYGNFPSINTKRLFQSFCTYLFFRNSFCIFQSNEGCFLDMTIDEYFTSNTFSNVSCRCLTVTQTSYYERVSHAFHANLQL